MEIRPLKTDAEIEEFINKNYGDYNAYRQDALNHDKPLPEPERVRKNAPEIALDYCEVVAKNRGMSLEEFFKRNPAAYEKYRALVTSYY